MGTITRFRFEGPKIRARKPRNSDWRPPCIEYTGKGNLLIYDGYGGRWFRSSQEAVEEEVAEFCKAYNEDDMQVCYCDLYSLWGIGCTDFGYQYGWSIEEKYKNEIEFEFTYIKADDVERNCDWNLGDIGEDVLIVTPKQFCLPYEGYWEM